MLNQKITFDRFVRGGLIVAALIGIYLLLKALSSVLWPFFVAWLLAYLMYPLVHFLETKCRLRYRILSIIVSLTLIIGIIAAFIVLTLPHAIEQTQTLADDLVHYATMYLNDPYIAAEINHFTDNILSEMDWVDMMHNKNIIDALSICLQQVWSLLAQTMGLLMYVVNSMMVMLYLFFILIDYEKIAHGWQYLIPKKHRPLATGIIGDVKHGMNAYFRGQSLIALIVGILFSIGFSIIGFPMAIGLGLFIGLLNMVPYMQVIGLVPTIFLALLEARDTDRSFWWLMLLALIVFAVVQLIQDLILTPRIMGKVMGLKPAIILLSLSVWGSLLGIIGLIIALPLTTLIWSYYKRLLQIENDEIQ